MRIVWLALITGLLVLSACTSVAKNDEATNKEWTPTKDTTIRKLVFNLPDMDKKMCETYPKLIIENLEGVTGVIDASFAYEGHVVTVLYDPNTILREEILENELYAWVGVKFISEEKIRGENAKMIFDEKQSNNVFDMPENHMDDVKQTDKGYQDIGAVEFKELINDKDVFVLDVHIPEQAHIPGTDALIPYNELEINKDQLPKDKNTPIALYCRSGSMSKEASDKLVEMGYTNINNLIGGANEWKANGFLVE